MSVFSLQHYNQESVDSIRRKWLYSFFIYYGLNLAFFLLHIISDSPSLRDWSFWLVPLSVYFFSYKRFDVYILMFFTSIFPLVLLYKAMDFIVVSHSSESPSIARFIFLVVLTLYSIFIYYCYQMLKINIQYNVDIYKIATERLWMFSFFAYRGLHTLRSIHDYNLGFKHSAAETCAIITVEIIIFSICYYFVVKRKGTWALWVILLFMPHPWFGKEAASLSIFSRIFWLGFFIYYCISSYRLHKVNKAIKYERSQDAIA